MVEKDLGTDSISHKTSFRNISQSLEGHGISCQSFTIALKFGRHLGRTAAEAPAQFRSDMCIFTPDLMTLRL